MRPYRGNRIDNGEEVKGWYFMSDSSLHPKPVHYIIVDEVHDRKSIVMEIGGERFACYKVIPETVGQLTSLKDKNGKEDWIDDIVETKVGGFIYRRRIFQAESGAFCINLPVIGATGGEDAIMLITCEHENIGNVHSNPGLLGERK